MKRIYISLSVILFGFLLCRSPGISNRVFAQEAKRLDNAGIRAKALEFAHQNRYIDAFTFLELAAPLYPDDEEVWAHYGIAILARSATLTSAEERKAERIKGYSVLTKAKKLGTDNIIALNLLDQLSPDGGDEDNFGGNPDFEKNLREGEGFFGRGEYDKAFTAYEKAYKINPKSYEAALFMGDSLYAGGKYRESETWFAKAVEIEPNREQSYRFWGDALMNQKKITEARDKFVEALVAEPFSRLTWERIGRWADETKTKVAPVEVTPPGNEPAGAITIDETLLKADDGTTSWKVYNETRKVQVIAGGGKSRTLANEVAALRKVAAAFRSDLKSGKVKYPDQNLSNLTKLDDAGLLEPYVLLIRGNENTGEEYDAYRAKNRDKLKKFIVEYLLGLSK